MSTGLQQVVSGYFVDIAASPILSSAAAGIFVFLTLYFVISTGSGILRALSKPLSLRFVFRGTDNDRMRAVRKEDTQDATYTFELAVRHDGGADVKELVWHLLIPAELNPKVSPFGGTHPQLETMKEDGEHFFHLTGIQAGTLHSGGFVHPEFKIEGKFQPVEKVFELYYWFKTEYGSYPQGMREEYLNNLAKLREEAGKLLLESPRMAGFE